MPSVKLKLLLNNLCCGTTFIITRLGQKYHFTATLLLNNLVQF